MAEATRDKNAEEKADDIERRMVISAGRRDHHFFLLLPA